MIAIPLFEFLWQEGEDPGARIVRCCDSILADGPMGNHERGDFYRYVISCGASPAIKGGGDIGTVRTSCAIFAGSILYWCGLPGREKLRPGVPGWPMFGGWLDGLSRRHPAWVGYQDGVQPEPGSLFYVEHPRNPNNNHVGFLLQETDPGVWHTAEGGGGDGTRCAHGERSMSAFDHWGRKLQGWWVPSRLGLEDTV